MQPQPLESMQPMLEAVRVTKSFGRTHALEDVSIPFFANEIHAILGENGAGKSTLMNILSGSLKPDSGFVQNQANRTIGMVHQHFMLVPAFSVAENLALGSAARFLLDVRSEAEHALQIGEKLGWKLDGTLTTRELSVGAQQRIEILKALATDASILIFDEPTAVLGPDEVLEFFNVLRKLRDEGKAIILIAHKLSEVLAIADRVTVLRRGKFIATAKREEVDSRTLAEWMVGELPESSDQSSEPHEERGIQVNHLEVEGDRKELAVRGVSFEVRRGEIVGIGGVDGNGQVELAEALAGIRPFRGQIQIQGAELKKNSKVAYIPQDRQRDGLALNMSVFENFVLEGHLQARFQKGWLLDIASLRAWCQDLIRRFAIKVRDASDPAKILSGGNQQKIVVARMLDEVPEAIIAVNPTRGLDISATQDVHAQLQSMAAQGVPIVLISTDLDEIAKLSHRTFSLSRGVLREGTDSETLVGGMA